MSIDQTKTQSKLATASAAVVSGAMEGLFFGWSDKIKNMATGAAHQSHVPRWRVSVNIVKSLLSTPQQLFHGTPLYMLQKSAQKGLVFFTADQCHNWLSPYLRPQFSGAFAGGVAGFGEWLVLHPVDNLKIQRQKGHSYIESYRLLTQRDGFAGLYRGSQATLLRNVPCSMVTFLLFYGTKPKKSENNNVIFESLLPAMYGVSGRLLMSQGLEVIKQRVQQNPSVQYGSTLQHLKQIVSQEGWRSLGAGLGVRFATSGIKMVAALTFFDQMKHFFTTMLLQPSLMTSAKSETMTSYQLEDKKAKNQQIQFPQTDRAAAKTVLGLTK